MDSLRTMGVYAPIRDIKKTLTASFDSVNYDFINFLSGAEQKIWFIDPVYYGQKGERFPIYSSFAIDHSYIDLSEFMRMGILGLRDIERLFDEKLGTDEVYAVKDELLYRAFQSAYKDIALEYEYADFLKEESYWIKDFTLFMALKDLYLAENFDGFEEKARNADESFLKTVAGLEERRRYHEFLQYFAHMQYKRLKEYALKKGVYIMSEMPYFVSDFSADVFSKKNFFDVDNNIRALSRPCYVEKNNYREIKALNYSYDYISFDGFEYFREKFRKYGKMYDYIMMNDFSAYDAIYSIDVYSQDKSDGEYVENAPDKIMKILEEEKLTDRIFVDYDDFRAGRLKDIIRSYKLPQTRILEYAFDGDMKNVNLNKNIEKNSIYFLSDYKKSDFLSFLEREEKKSISFLKEYYNKEEINIKDIYESFYDNLSNKVIMPIWDLLLRKRALKDESDIIDISQFRLRLETKLKEEAMRYNR